MNCEDIKVISKKFKNFQGYKSNFMDLAGK